MTIKGKLVKELWWTVTIADPEVPLFGQRQILVEADTALEVGELTADRYKVLSMEQITIQIIRKVEE